jgi:putative tryptophan/tyrosine transport system ATP-binding protein
MNMIELKNISLQLYKNTILSDISFSVNSGDFVIVLGNNGSGKSSLLKLITQHYQPSAGNIYYRDQLLTQYSAKELHQDIMMLSQNCHQSCFPSLTLYENYLLRKKIRFPVHKKEKHSLRHLLAEYNVNLCEKLDLPVQQLSGGEAQAFVLALSLLQPPSLLLLDENTSALDPKTAEQLMVLTYQKIIQHKITCIMTTHNLDIAMRYGTRILFLQNGRIHKRFDDKAEITREGLLANY